MYGFISTAERVCRSERDRDGPSPRKPSNVDTSSNPQVIIEASSTNVSFQFRQLLRTEVFVFLFFLPLLLSFFRSIFSFAFFFFFLWFESFPLFLSLSPSVSLSNPSRSVIGSIESLTSAFLFFPKGNPQKYFLMIDLHRHNYISGVCLDSGTGDSRKHPMMTSHAMFLWVFCYQFCFLSDLFLFSFTSWSTRLLFIFSHDTGIVFFIFFFFLFVLVIPGSGVTRDIKY